MIDRIAQALSGRRLLVVLDNCEHVLDAAARSGRGDPGSHATVKVIATSREGLRVAAEQLWAVPSLDVAGGGDFGRGGVVRRTRPGRGRRVRAARRGRQRGGDGDLSAPGRDRAGDRVGRGPDGVDEPGGGGATVERPVPAAVGVTTRPGTPPDVAPRGAVVLRPARRRRTGGAGPLFGVRRGLRPRRRHPRVRRRGSTSTRCWTCWTPWCASRWSPPSSARGHARYAMLETIRQFAEEQLAAAGSIERCGTDTPRTSPSRPSRTGTSGTGPASGSRSTGWTSSSPTCAPGSAGPPTRETWPAPRPSPLTAPSWPSPFSATNRPGGPRRSSPRPPAPHLPTSPPLPRRQPVLVDRTRRGRRSVTPKTAVEIGGRFPLRPLRPRLARLWQAAAYSFAGGSTGPWRSTPPWDQLGLAGVVGILWADPRVGGPRPKPRRPERSPRRQSAPPGPRQPVPDRLHAAWLRAGLHRDRSDSSSQHVREGLAYAREHRVTIFETVFARERPASKPSRRLDHALPCSTARSARSTEPATSAIWPTRSPASLDPATDEAPRDRRHPLRNRHATQRAQWPGASRTVFAQRSATPFRTLRRRWRGHGARRGRALRAARPDRTCPAGTPPHLTRSTAPRTCRCRASRPPPRRSWGPWISWASPRRCFPSRDLCHRARAPANRGQLANVSNISLMATIWPPLVEDGTRMGVGTPASNQASTPSRTAWGSRRACSSRASGRSSRGQLVASPLAAAASMSAISCS